MLLIYYYLTIDCYVALFYLYSNFVMVYVRKGFMLWTKHTTYLQPTPHPHPPS